MNTNNLFVLAALLVVNLAFQGNCAAVEGKNTVKLTGAFNPVGNLFMIDYERLLNDSISIGGRVATLNYEIEDGSYTEKGDGSGVEATFRWYPRSNGLNGFFLGAGLGYWETNWSWTDPYDIPTSGDGTSESVDVNFTVGWKIGFGSAPVYFEPSVIVGQYIDVTTDSSYQGDVGKTELGFYAGVGLAIGFAF